MKKIEEKDCEKLVDVLLANDFSSMFSNLVGKKVDFRLNKQSKKEMSQIFLQMFGMFSEFEEMKKKKKPVELTKFMLNSFNSLFHKYIPDLSESEHFVDSYIRDLTESLSIPSDIFFLKETQFLHYRDLLEQLILRITYDSKIKDAKELVTELIDSGDGLIIAQSFIIRLEKSYQYLDKPRIRLTTKTIEKHIKFYGELAGHFEKMLALMVGLITLLKTGDVLNYKKLRKNGLSLNESIVRADSEFHDFVAPFNRHIRNAIAHNSIYFMPIDKKIKFLDLNQTIILNFEDFVSLVKEFSSLVLVLSQVQVHILLSTYKIFKQILDGTFQLK